jgi:hypothetical protein
MKQDQRNDLERPFPEEVRRTRRGGHGKDLTYVETHNYIRRLNQAFEGDWSFTIQEHIRTDEEVIVVGRLVAGGVEKVAFGGSSITRSRDSGDVVSLADDLKSAASDALKKAASLMGVGLDLYAEASEQPAESPRASKVQPIISTGNQLTQRQYRAIMGLSAQAGISEIDLGKWVQNSYGVSVDELDRREASEVITKINQSINGGNGKAAGGTA